MDRVSAREVRTALRSAPRGFGAKFNSSQRARAVPAVARGRWQFPIGGVCVCVATAAAKTQVFDES